MRRWWERDRSLAHVPFGWRRAAASVLAVAAEHCLPVGVTVRWSSTPHPFCPALAVLEPPVTLGNQPLHRLQVEHEGRALMQRIAQGARATCMACGALAAPAHVQLQSASGPFIALLCAECEDAAAYEGADFWAVVGRFDPLLLDPEHDPDDSGSGPPAQDDGTDDEDEQGPFSGA